MHIEQEGNTLAGQVWEKHELTQKASLAKEALVRLLSEEVVDGLRHYFGAPQPESGVFFDKQFGNVGITINPGFKVPQSEPELFFGRQFSLGNNSDSHWEFCRSGGFRQVIFETNQNTALGDRSLRRFMIRGSHPENRSGEWEVEFIIGGSGIMKRENREALIFEQADALLVLTILGGIKDQLERLKLNKRR